MQRLCQCFSNSLLTTSSTLGQLPRSVENSIVTGFQVRLLKCFSLRWTDMVQMAMRRGPLCGEPVMGVCIVLEFLSCQLWDPSKGVQVRPKRVSSCVLRYLVGPDSYGPLSGQLISTMSTVCHEAMKGPVTLLILRWLFIWLSARALRLVEPVYEAHMQISVETMGRLFDVLAQRRAKVTREEAKEGTSYFIVSAILPVVESFGFANAVRTETSGVASPQLLFSGWQLVEQDPAWVPTTAEELEEFGTDVDAIPNRARDLVREIRRRKGLSTEEAVIQHAEKQRTLARKK